MTTQGQKQAPETRLMTMRQAARYLCLSERSLHELKKSAIPEVRIGRKVLFDRNDLDKFIELKKGNYYEQR